MPRGSKEKYTDKQKRQAEHIEEGYEERGLNETEATRRFSGKGLAGFLQKPYTAARLGEKVKAILGDGATG